MNRSAIRILHKSLVLLSLLHCICSAQTAPKIKWQKCYGGKGRELFPSIITTRDGGYIFAGSSDSVSGDVTSVHTQGVHDFWIVKLDSAGNIQWQKSYGGSSPDYAYSIIQTSDNGYAVTGFTNSTDGDVPDGIGKGDGDVWIIKIDSIGKLLSEKCIGGTSNDVGGSSIIQTFDQGYAVVGLTQSNNGDILGNHGLQDGLFVKLDSVGNIKTVRCFGGSGNDAFQSIIQTPDSGYVICGTIGSSDEGFGDVHQDKFGYVTDLWVLKLDKDLIIEWQIFLGGYSSDEGRSITLTRDGGYAVTGLTRSTDGDVTGYHGGDDIWVSKLNHLGKIQWQRTLGGSLDEDVYSIIQTEDSGFVVAGLTDSHDGDVNGLHFNKKDSSDGWVVKLSKLGELEWQKCVGGTARDGLTSVVETSTGELVVAGWTESDNGDVSGNHGNSDIWAVKLSPPANAVNDFGSGGTKPLWIYPNPTNEVANLFLFESTTVQKIQFYDLLGIQYFPDYKVANNILTIDTHDLPTGSFIVRVAYQNTTRDEIRKFVHVR